MANESYLVYDLWSKRELVTFTKSGHTVEAGVERAWGVRKSRTLA